MAINLASKYEKKVSERFTLGSLTDAGAGHDYGTVEDDAQAFLQQETVTFLCRHQLAGA